MNNFQGPLTICGVLFIVMLSFWVNSCSPSVPPITENDFENAKLNPFVEKDFPFISTYLDARNLGDNFPDDNVVSRGLIINLDDSAFVCFDRDLLRWSVAWTGKHLIESILPQISYNDYFNKMASIPQIAGNAQMANGIYPGWSKSSPILKDIREKSNMIEGFIWGPLPDTYARWNGAYIHDKKVVLSYEIGGTKIKELPGIRKDFGEVVFTRTLEVDATNEKLYMNVAEIRNGTEAINDGNMSYIYLNSNRDSVLAVGFNQTGSTSTTSLILTDDRYFTVALTPSSQKQNLDVFIWKGAASDLEKFRALTQKTTITIPSVQKGSKMRWKGEVLTKGKVTKDTALFVTDLLTLPFPNPWKRNVRVTDLAFIDNETAVVSTFEGDVWRVTGINDNLSKLSWKRLASGLYEPMSIAYHEGLIYVFGKEGIVRLHDLNGDEEIDYYENFCDLMAQSAESYAWATDMVFSKAHQAIFIAKGGAVASRAGLSKRVDKGFRAGSHHDGVIMKISLDGRRSEVHSTGFRAPFLGLHPESGLMTATDQQGNFVSTTPIYLVEKGDFFGVPATIHRTDNPATKAPLAWIPHRIDRSAAQQIWMTSGKFGPLNDALVHFSFGKPGLFKVLIDSTSNGLQGGVTPIPASFSTPILKGVIGPADGQLYLAGFNLLGSSSKGVSAIQRLRYTGKESHMVNGFHAGTQGVLLSFDSALDPITVSDSTNFRVKRWNYQRTDEYGSGHFKSDGSPGEEIIPVLGSYLSADSKKVFLLLPDMKETDQLELMFDLKSREGKSIMDGIWLMVKYLSDMEPYLGSFNNVDLSRLNMNPAALASLIKSDTPITREKGKELFETKGCIGCHSPGTETAGMYGPPFKGLYGSNREMTTGEIIEADDDYLKESILEPGKRIVNGFEGEMPSFQGVLTDSEIEALIMYIMYLKY